MTGPSPPPPPPPAPTISRFEPDTVFTGDTVNISGRNFGTSAAGVTVKVSGEPGDVLSIADTILTFRVPVAPNGGNPVTVTIPDKGSVQSAFSCGRSMRPGDICLFAFLDISGTFRPVRTVVTLDGCDRARADSIAGVIQQTPLTITQTDFAVTAEFGSLRFSDVIAIESPGFSTIGILQPQSDGSTLELRFRFAAFVDFGPPQRLVVAYQANYDVIRPDGTCALRIDFDSGVPSF